MAILINAIGERFTRTTSLPTADAHTFCCWVRRQGDQNNYSMFAQLMNTGGTIGNYLGFLSNGDDIGLSNYSSDVTVLSAPGTGNWVFAAMTCSGSGAGLFIGYAGLATAASLSSATHTRGTFTAQRIDIGADQFGENQLNGDIAYLKIWGAALTAQELEQERWSAWPVRWANLNSFYPFLTPSDDTIDYSGAALTITRTSAGTQADNPPVAPRLFAYRNGWQGAFTAAGGAPADPEGALVGGKLVNRGLLYGGVLVG